MRPIGFSIRRQLLSGAFILASIGPLSAHDVWLTVAGQAAERRAVVNYGHPDDRPPAFADKIIDLVAITAAGRSSLLGGAAPKVENGISVVESMPFADDKHTLLAARYDNGFWVKMPDGSYRNATRRLVPDAADCMWSVKFAKALTGADAPWNTVLGYDLEIVPLSDPVKTSVGQTLRLKVLFHGKPLEGAEVERGDGVTVVAEKDIPRFTTDADGVAAVPLVRTGPHLLVIDHKVTPSASPDQANADLYNATLWFSVSKQ